MTALGVKQVSLVSNDARSFRPKSRKSHAPPRGLAIAHHAASNGLAMQQLRRATRDSGVVTRLFHQLANRQKRKDLWFPCPLSSLPPPPPPLARMPSAAVVRACGAALQLAAGMLFVGARADAAITFGKSAAVELLHMPEVYTCPSSFCSLFLLFLVCGISLV